MSGLGKVKGRAEHFYWPRNTLTSPWGERSSWDNLAGFAVPVVAQRVARCEGLSLLFLGLFEHLCRTSGRCSGTDSSQIWLLFPFKQESNFAQREIPESM